MRSYGQYCSIARSVDVVGDRWTLLIVRELLLQGPCRFTDLRNGLPGVAANLLSTRLKELEAAGLITREDAPPPIATALYQLTGDGLALEPVLKALGLWGLRFMGEERPDDVFQARWLAFVLPEFIADSDPDAPPAVIALTMADESAVIELRDGGIHSRPGRATEPDLVLDGPPRAIVGLLRGMFDLEHAGQFGLSARGRRDLLTRLRPIAQDEARTHSEVRP
ncbi:winged helix-turn-helix transcriptional regulator [Streptomyces polygonati]|uniref:Winged helix-turn-helix transcriptional regulator n=1 Tax=Streptomyces polygonati TaxID=1617087 RepID=A0ABV8HVW8_9ACTN